ncbi:WXG100 family type VII secretion target [Tsukamurella strandjordii]|uniref:ESAT-6-like protein n=1 Tax=Tsukamurella strandjordii TaxID=147577 RepID=A0AA90NCT9_9ACTN|nr:WXG100 family type VII secretion target [Tsukamurella strandjordii]MDP0400006.1 WXG100 family type VII secretion target [Tsukamurella strandjordii]
MHADLAAIRSASRDISDAHTAITEEWRTLADSAEQLFGGTWRGYAAKSYTEPWGECRRGYQDILDSLQFLGESVAKAAESYSKQERANTEDIASVTVKLNL